MWYMEQLKRDQDEHCLYIYNDFSGYGVTEVMENQVRKQPSSETPLLTNTASWWSLIKSSRRRLGLLSHSGRNWRVSRCF